MQFFCKSRGPDQMAKQAKDVMNLTYFLLVFVSEQSKKLVDGWKAWKSWRREEKNKTQWKLLQFVVWRHDGKTEFAKKKNKASRLIAGDKSLNLSPRMIEWTILVDEKILPRKFFVTNFFAPQWKMKKSSKKKKLRQRNRFWLGSLVCAIVMATHAACASSSLYKRQRFWKIFLWHRALEFSIKVSSITANRFLWILCCSIKIKANKSHHQRLVDIFKETANVILAMSQSKGSCMAKWNIQRLLDVCGQLSAVLMLQKSRDLLCDAILQCFPSMFPKLLAARVSNVLSHSLDRFCYRFFFFYFHWNAVFSSSFHLYLRSVAAMIYGTICEPQLLFPPENNEKHITRSAVEKNALFQC